VYFVHTERFISTDNIIDRGVGTPPAVYYTPIYDPASACMEPGVGIFPSCATNTNATFLADSQNNNAGAVFGDANWDISKEWEIDAALRFDQDDRRNTTDTPAPYLEALGLPDVTGEQRKAVFRALQPKGTIRYKPSDTWTLYTDWSRGFRSGGFNQTGVDANHVAGVNDIFQAEIADTYEVGTKMEFLERRLTLDADVYHTNSYNGYFFDYIAADSTQNLGNVSASYKGAELSLTYRPTRQLDLYLGGGYTDSRITAPLVSVAANGVVTEDPTVIGNQAPLVSRDTVNAGFEYREPVASGVDGTIRMDYNEIGRTWWEPYNITSRDPVNLVDLRLGLQGKQWTATLWSKNLFNEIYNAEFSPAPAGAGFLWRALPRTFGADFGYKF
jgi:iron complex outermembrane recepter protein